MQYRTIAHGYREHSWIEEKWPWDQSLSESSIILVNMVGMCIVPLQVHKM